MNVRMDTLIGDGYSILKFADLPTHCQMAALWYTVMECDCWEDVAIPNWETSEQAKDGLFLLLPKYVDLYGEELFGMVTLSADALKSSVMQDEDIAESYTSWDEYHADYTRGYVPKHPETNRWPVLLSYDNYETLWDGWHRFHSYIRDGATVIQAMFNPHKHHLVARQR